MNATAELKKLHMKRLKYKKYGGWDYLQHDKVDVEVYKGKQRGPVWGKIPGQVGLYAGLGAMLCAMSKAKDVGGHFYPLPGGYKQYKIAYVAVLPYYADKAADHIDRVYEEWMANKK